MDEKALSYQVANVAVEPTEFPYVKLMDSLKGSSTNVATMDMPLVADALRDGGVLGRSKGLNYHGRRGNNEPFVDWEVNIYSAREM